MPCYKTHSPFFLKPVTEDVQRLCCPDLIRGWGSFHCCGARTRMSLDQDGRAPLSNGTANRPEAKNLQWFGRSVGFDHSLETKESSFLYCPEGSSRVDQCSRLLTDFMIISRFLVGKSNILIKQLMRSPQWSWSFSSCYLIFVHEWRMVGSVWTGSQRNYSRERERLTRFSCIKRKGDVPNVLNSIPELWPTPWPFSPRPPIRFLYLASVIHRVRNCKSFVMLL